MEMLPAIGSGKKVPFFVLHVFLHVYIIAKNSVDNQQARLKICQLAVAIYVFVTVDERSTRL